MSLRTRIAKCQRRYHEIAEETAAREDVFSQNYLSSLSTAELERLIEENQRARDEFARDAASRGIVLPDLSHVSTEELRRRIVELKRLIAESNGTRWAEARSNGW